MIVLLIAGIILFLDYSLRQKSPESTFAPEYLETQSSDMSEYATLRVSPRPTPQTSPLSLEDTEWTEEERVNVSKSTPALVTAVESTSDGWMFSLDYLSVNPKFIPGESGPYWLNQNPRVRTVLLSKDSKPATKGILVCNGTNYPKYQSVTDWKTLVGGMPYAFTITDAGIIQVHLICVP